MHSNNEVGTLQPIKEIAAIANEHSILMHTDCAQSIGKVPVNAKDLGVSLLSITAHKFYGPKGIGCLFVTRGVEKMITPQIHGSHQQNGLRPGTENVPLIVGIGQAMEVVQVSVNHWGEHAEKQRNALYTQLTTNCPVPVRLNGPQTINDRRLPNTLSVSFKGLEAMDILRECTEVAASAGSACGGISRVLQEMKVPEEFGRGTLRLSVGLNTTGDDITNAVAALHAVVARLSGQHHQPQQPQQPQQEEQQPQQEESGDQQKQQQQQAETKQDEQVL
jgi:cysteine sulfinate desulfinase/cysteine desulfurase-like protein